MFAVMVTSFVLGPFQTETARPSGVSNVLCGRQMGNSVRAH